MEVEKKPESENTDSSWHNASQDIEKDEYMVVFNWES